MAKIDVGEGQASCTIKKSTVCKGVTMKWFYTRQKIVIEM